MAMELLEGIDLEKLTQRGPLSIQLAADCILQAAEALAEAHVGGDRPSRHQAVEPLPHPAPRRLRLAEGPRLRHLEARARARRRPVAHVDAGGDRIARVHGARADPDLEVRHRQGRRLGARRRSLRDPHDETAVRGRHRRQRPRCGDDAAPCVSPRASTGRLRARRGGGARVSREGSSCAGDAGRSRGWAPPVRDAARDRVGGPRRAHLRDERAVESAAAADASASRARDHRAGAGACERGAWSLAPRPLHRRRGVARAARDGRGRRPLAARAASARRRGAERSRCAGSSAEPLRLRVSAPEIIPAPTVSQAPPRSRRQPRNRQRR